MPDLQSRYQSLLDNGSISADEYQAHAVKTLQDFQQRLQNAQPTSNYFWQQKTYPLVRGVYLWGGVGRGKTWLMDLFYESLPVREKKREHFHRFMRSIHELLHQHKKQSDPLKKIATKMAKEVRVLCLDEFHVVDIADAMILAQLLEGLFDNGISLLTTSNVAPEGLYSEGIQRASFLPAIDLLEQHTVVRQIGGDFDYRLATLEQAQVYLTGESGKNFQLMEKEFQKLAPANVESQGELQIAGRQIPFYKKSDDLIWFHFKDICHGPRSATDYLEISRCYHTVFLDSIPCLDGSRDDCVRRFIAMIDVFYDARVKLVINAQLEPDKLYQGERLAFEFQRTASRLQEMQSHEYLALAHKP